MKFWQTKWFHAIGTALATVGAAAAHVIIPAAATIPLGPLNVSVANVVAGGLALAAAQGITPNRQVQAAIEAAAVKR